MHNNTNARTRVQIHVPDTQAPDRARLITEQAQAWTSFVLEHSRMKAETVYRKALDSVAFSLEVGARALAIPSKLGGTSAYQDALATLHALNPIKGHRLETDVEKGAIVVAFSGMVLGRVQDKHVSWLRPLLACGASVHFLAVTGTERTEGFLGCNVALANVSVAIDRLRDLGGDGAQGAVALAEDIRLWRDERGAACTNVAHFVRHSPTGLEWGYGGSGPADLALSILKRFTGPETADRFYQRFKEDVIATVPREGGSIRAAFVISWLAAHGA